MVLLLRKYKKGEGGSLPPMGASPRFARGRAIRSNKAAWRYAPGGFIPLLSLARPACPVRHRRTGQRQTRFTGLWATPSAGDTPATPPYPHIRVPLRGWVEALTTVSALNPRKSA
jgi:hypothetical protein